MFRVSRKLRLCAALMGFFASLTAGAAIQFQDITAAAGLTHAGDSWGVAWGDFNNDGWPDLYDGNHRERPAFFINQRNGTFANYYNSIFSHNLLEDFIDTHGAQWVDLDNDGHNDLIVSVGGNGGGLAKAWNNTQVLMNRNGRLDQQAEELGLANPEFRGRTPLAFDYNTDGLLDVLLTNITPVIGARLFNQSPYMIFQDVTSTVGLPLDGTTLFAMIADLDGNDVQELLYGMKGTPMFNYNPPLFMDVRSIHGAVDVDEYDMAIGDFDGDLRPDIFRGGGHFGRTILEQPGADTATFRYLWPAVPTTLEVGFTFRATGPVKFELDGGWVTINDYFIGSGGWHPPIVGTINGPMIVELDPANPDTHGIYNYDFSANAGNVIIGYEPEFDRWKVVFLHEDRGAGLEKPTLSGKITATGGAITILDRIGTYEPQYVVPSKMYKNTLTGLKKYGSEVGIDSSVSGGVHVVAADFDNDGDLDIYASNSSPVSNTSDFIYENQGGIFTKHLVGLDSLLGNGSNVAVADYDLDGYLDVYVTHGAGSFPFNTGPHQLLRNTASGKNWLQIDLEGVASNRDGIGARVRLKANGVTQERYQDGGMHKYGQNMQRLHFGLNTATRVERIEVRWPSGNVQYVDDVAVNQVIRIQEQPAQSVSRRGPPASFQSPGFYMWQEYYDGPCQVRIQGSTVIQQYRVNLVSDRDVAGVVAQETAPGSVLNASPRGFGFLSNSAQWQGGVDFNLHPRARAMISMQGPEGANPRSVFFGGGGNRPTPAGWIVGKNELPVFSGYTRGVTQGLYLGAATAGSPEYRLRWSARNSSHRYSLWLATDQPGLTLGSTAGLLETGDRLSVTDSSLTLDGQIAAPWEDGINLTGVPGDLMAITFSMDGLFQRQYVSLFQPDGNNFPNAYWIEPITPVGEPPNVAGQPTVKIWKEEGRGRWHVKFTAGGVNANIVSTGEISSTGTLTVVDISTLEAADSVNSTVPGSLAFNVRVYGNWNDEIVFDAGADDALTFNLDGAGGVQQLRIGAEGWPVRAVPVVLQ